MTPSELMQAMSDAGAPFAAILIAIAALDAKDAQIAAQEAERAEKRARDAERKREARASGKVRARRPRTIRGQSKECPADPPIEELHTPTEISPSGETREAPARKSGQRHPIPDDWQPRQFGVGTESRKVVDAWPPGEEAAQLEQFKANHRGKGNTFIDPQDAWSTWVLNSRKFGHGGRQHSSTSKPTTRQSGQRVAADYASRGDSVIDLVPRLGAPSGHVG